MRRCTQQKRWMVFLLLATFSLLLSSARAGQGGFLLVASSKKQSPLSNLIFTENIAFEVAASSVLMCANTCLRFKGCYGFTLAMSTSSVTSCRGYTTVVTSQTAALASPDSKTFVIQRRTSAWLDKTCVSDAECPTGLSAQCFADRCRCTPGYYYSHATDICTAECALSDLQPNFVDYPARYIEDNNVQDPCAQDLILEDCTALCLQEPLCRAMEYVTNAGEPIKCCMNKVTPLDKPDKWINDPQKHFFQRTCV